MIQVNISEIKNRLSHYLRLVRGGQEIEIVDRKTPVARISAISHSRAGKEKAPWIHEAIRLGLVDPPKDKKLSVKILQEWGQKNSKMGRPKASVLEALLEERESGR